MIGNLLSVTGSLPVICDWTVTYYTPRFTTEGSGTTIRRGEKIPLGLSTILAVTIVDSLNSDTTVVVGVQHSLKISARIQRSDPDRWVPDESTARGWKDQLGKLTRGWFISLSDGRQLVLFPATVEFRCRNNGHWKYHSSLDPIRFSQIVFSPAGHKPGEIPFEHNDKPVQIDTSLPRWGGKFKLTYETAQTLKPGHVFVQKRPLYRAFDSELPSLLCDVDGFNVATDGVEFSVPLFWPGDHWNLPQLEAVRPFARVGMPLYEEFVRLRIGSWVASISDVATDDTGNGESHFIGKRSKGPKELRESFPGYGDPSVRYVGFCPISTFDSRTGEQFFVYDSPLTKPERALRVYDSFKAAEDWAKGGSPRRNLSVQPLLRLKHDARGEWKRKFLDYITARCSPDIVEKVQAVLFKDTRAAA